MKERKGVPLTLKITMVSLGVLLVSLLALGMYSYRTTKEKLISHTLHEISAELSRISDEVNLVLRNQIHAVLLLSGLPIFQSEEGEVSLKWPGERVKRMLERVFALVASEQREFFQIRLLSTDGMELLRLDATPQMLRFTPTAELQDKSGRYYFTEAMKLSPGEVYISPIDLNVEHGEIEVPHRPTYRIATPIFNEAGERLGVIVVNVDARSLLDSFYAKLKGGTVYLVDQDGYFLEHPDSSMTFGRELGTGHNLSKKMPELYRWLRSSLEEYVGRCEGGRTIYGMRKIYYAGQKEDRFWALFEVIPTEVVLADTREVRNRFLMDGGLIGGMAFALGFILLRFFSRPITRLSQLAQRVAEGDLDVRASDEEKRRDEIGVLARAFNQMISSLREATMNLREQVEKQTEELRRRNEELRRQARYLEETDLYNRTFVEILYLFTELTDHKAVCNEILSVLAERHGYPVGITYSYDEWSDTLTLCSAYSAPATVKEEIKVGEGIVGQAALSRKPILIPLSSLTLELGLNDVHPAAILALPVRYRERLFGVMVLASLSEPSEREKEFLHRLSILIGAGMNSLRQFLNLQRLSRELQERQVEIERKNRELLQAQKMKDQFMANMSHELRTPLNSIIGFADLLKEKIIGTLNEKQLQYVQNILQSAEHLLSIINDILDLSKVEAGMMEVKPEVISLKDLIESSLTMVGERAAKHRISLSMEIGEGIGTVRTDPTRLKQILFNLLSNAVKFTPDGGSVSVKARKLDGEIQISVSDTGIGIPKEKMEEIFEPFVQLDGSLSRRYEGTGLGLALTRRLVELLGGRIWVESQPGKGSTFHFTISAELEEKGDKGEERRVEERSLTEERRSPAVREKRLALIVEDDPGFASLLREYLEDLGCRTAVALSGEDGLRMARQLKPDLITLDIMMPLMDGWQFLERLNEDEELRGTPVVIISILHDEGKGTALGASAVLQKPIDRSSLKKALERAGLARKDQAKVLVVDDDPDAVEIVSETLSSMGYAVLKAYGGGEGMRIAEEERPDLIVLDLMMPEMNGFDVIEYLKNDPKTRDIPIVILTAKHLTEEDIRRLNGHIVSITRKGEFNKEGFLREVRNALGGNPTHKKETKHGKDSGGGGP